LKIATPRFCHGVVPLIPLKRNLALFVIIRRYLSRAYVRQRTYCERLTLQYFRFTMNKADSDRFQELCSQIAVEQDRARFLKLVTELNNILSESESQLRKQESSDACVSDPEPDLGGA
jgi:hypothetical protein